MKFLRRYRDYQKFQEEYAASGTTTETTAIQCNGIICAYLEYDQKVQYVWEGDDRFYVSTQERNPVVGDTAIADNKEQTEYEIEAVTANTINGYVEPWVSLTDKNNITVSVLSDNAIVEDIPIPSEYTYTYLGEYDIDTSGMMA